MDTLGIIVLIVIIILLFLFIRCFRIVPQAHVFVIERLGSFHAQWETGLHILVPFIDRIAGKVSLKEKVVDFKPQPVITKDNVTMQIDTVVFYQVTDAKQLSRTCRLQHFVTSSVRWSWTLLSHQEMLSIQRSLLSSIRLLTAGVAR